MVKDKEERKFFKMEIKYVATCGEELKEGGN